MFTTYQTATAVGPGRDIVLVPKERNKMQRSYHVWFFCFTFLQLTCVAGAYAASGACQTVKLNDVYLCPTQAALSDQEFLYVKGDPGALYAGKLRRNVLYESYLFGAPDGWEMRQHSISPNRKVILVRMSRPDCDPNWPSGDGESCSWGASVLFAAFSRQSSTSGDYYELVNLASYYGKYSHIFGWQTWLADNKVLFSAKIAADMNNPRSGFAYILSLDYNDTNFFGISIGMWGGAINSDACSIGRMHATVPTYGSTRSCFEGQYVVFTRRCFDDAVSLENYSWWNTKNYDGSGGQCREFHATQLVPVLKNYVVPIDHQCNPILFERAAPIRIPDWTGRYRHMGSGPEWGDAQPTISPDGRLVAFWSTKSSELASPDDNCAGFETETRVGVGNGAGRVRLCLLDDSHQKCASIASLPQPTNPWDIQHNPYFYKKDDGNIALFTSEVSGFFLTDLVTGEKTRLFAGQGGYPIPP
jgi:hypothetical protein